MNMDTEEFANYAEELRNKMNQAIGDTVNVCACYANNFFLFTRNRKLPLEVLIKLLLTMTGGTLARELYDAGIDAALSSFVERRKQIGYQCFRDVMERFNGLCNDPKTLKGYRLWAVDGSTIPCPRNPNSANYFTSEANPKGWNNTHANLVLDILNQTFVDCYMGGDKYSSRTAHDEQGALYSLIYQRKYHQPTIVVLDRGYEAHNTIAHLQSNQNLYFVLRVKQDKGALRPVRELPMEEEIDRDLSWTITTRQTNEAKEKGWIFLQTGSKKGKTNSPGTRITRWDFVGPMFPDAYPMQCRAVRFMLDSGQYETLLTNLPRDEFSIADLKAIYHMRWKIETNIRFLKYCVGLLNLHSRTDELILQELYAHLTMFNFCNRICREIEIPQKSGNKYEYKIDMSMAIYICKKFFRDQNFSGEKLIRDISRYVQPIRPNRADERNLKTKSFAGFPYRIPS